MEARCKTIREMELVNLYCWLAAYADALPRDDGRLVQPAAALDA